MKSILLIASFLSLAATACVAESDDLSEDVVDESGDEVTATLDPQKAPGKNLDLSKFKLQLPVASGSSVVEIGQPKLATYTDKYFFTGSDGAMTFWAPVTGAHTPNTHYPRSELRESSGDWHISGTHTLTATAKVLQQPSEKGIIVGQIHGHLDDSEVLKIFWSKGGDVVAQFEEDHDETKQKNVTIGNYPIGKQITYTIKMQNRKLSVTITDSRGSKTVSSPYTDSHWDKDTYYFKLGSYVQDNQGSSSEGGKVSFYSFKIQHGG